MVTGIRSGAGPGRGRHRFAGARHGRWWRDGATRRRVVAVVAAVLAPMGVLQATAGAAVTAPGNGFVITAGDISFILRQIKIAERHVATMTPDNPCGTLVGPNVNQIPDRITSYGLRLVDGSCNNLFPGRERFAAADEPFPRLTPAGLRDADVNPGTFGPAGPTSYKNLTPGNVVVDSQPRVASNLIVDQTSTNPAAVAATIPVRSQDSTPSAVPCSVPSAPTDPADCVKPHHTLFIPNVTTDVGLSPPFNSVFTFFGQFFDHGVDQTVKTGGTVFVPLRADDPLRTLGPDGDPNTPDQVPPSQAFMVLTRAQVAPGPDGQFGTADDVPDADNTDTPWVDQSQTYTSHASHQAFLREYQMVGGRPVSTGKFLGGSLDAAGHNVPVAAGVAADQGISTWASTKAQAADKLGVRLVDADVLNQPMIAADVYGNLIPGPNGFAQWVTATGLVEGNPAAPVPAPANVVRYNTPFLTDIAHNADPSPQDADHNPGTPPVAPTPDGDTVVNPDQAGPIGPGTYDDEGLAAHFTCGDGRCNENIALTAVHQIFHSEHDRVADDVLATLDKPGNEALKADFLDVAPKPGDPNDPKPFTVGERLFQTARFVTEMEYQHLVFEEFARKMVPAIRPFHVYSPDINPAVQAEFAHAVYRFGHSMLDDDVARVNEDAAGNKTSNSLPLLTAFLNPTEYRHNGGNPDYTPAQAAGAIFMGSSDQTGNEIDEFVTETLRNNLLGLPLDLPTLNMARARDAGIPRLNEVRRIINAKTNDASLAPYTSWADFGQHLKHPESLINYVAAYGQHPTIRDSGPDGVLGNGDDVTTVAAKRNAARAIVDPRQAPLNPGDPPADVQPADAADFMFATGTWANQETGLNDVDLWVGGLGEVTNLFGGHLGSTFNYVFQTQLEALQDGDRLYYLARTPGMNLRTQLEGNSFSEIIQRNTDGTHTLKADAFATADCKFETGHITPFSGLHTASQDLVPPLAPIATAGAVNDDPTSTDCDENQLLLRQPDGTIQYRARNNIDPTGINGQSVYHGTPGVDRITGGNDNDTFWGDEGNDVIEGSGGDDVALGGPGDDIITDLDGADVPKGGPGNDAIDAGPGDDIPMGNEGKDVINGGLNDNETFAGEGDDFVIAGAGADAVFGDGGDDWIEGGTGQDLLQGDHGAPFFDDPAEFTPGNDIFVGQNGENDYDAEGGDDVMSQNPAIDRNAGAGGFDWAIHQYDFDPANPVGADDDMKINQQLAGLPLPVVVNRDRWQETEADSGGRANDVIRGDDLERVTGGFGFSGCDALDPAGVARITNLNKLVTTFPSQLAAHVAVSPHNFCPLVGQGGSGKPDGTGTVWAEGNILLGGAGSDTLEGRGNNDIIDGDHGLTVRISVRANPDGTGAELGSTDLMENRAVTGTFGPGTTNMTLQQAVFAGLVNPGQLVGVRDIANVGATAANGLAGDCGPASIDPATGKVTGAANCDVALFSAPLAGNYTITPNADGSITVADNAFVAAADLFAKGDGVDTLWNMEALAFCDANDAVTKNCTHYDVHPVSQFTAPAAVVPAAPTITSVTPGAASAVVAFTLGAAGTSPITGVTVTATPAGGGAPVTQSFTGTPPAGPVTVTGLTNGTAFTFTVAATSAAGTGPASSPSAPVTPVAPVTVPGAPTAVTAAVPATNPVGGRTLAVSWTAPAATGGAAITGYRVTTTSTTAGAVVPAPLTVTGTTATVGGLTNGASYRFTVAATNSAGTGPASAPSAVAIPRAPTAPSPLAAPTVTRPVNAPFATTASVVVNWVPGGNGGSAFTGFRVEALNAANAVVVNTLVGNPAATSLTVTGRTPGTALRFRVTAINAVGSSPVSPLSAAVTPATVPAPPATVVAVGGIAGGAINATVVWTAAANTGGSAVTGYQVIALNQSNPAAAPIRSAVQAATARTLVMTLPAPAGQTYRFQVVAVNAIGTSAPSASSAAVIAR